MLFQFGLKSNYALAICILHLTGNRQKVCQWGAQCDCGPGGHFWTWTWSASPLCSLTKRTQRVVSAEISDCVFYVHRSPGVVSKGDKKRKSKVQRECRCVKGKSVCNNLHIYIYIHFYILHYTLRFHLAYIISVFGSNPDLLTSVSFILTG